MDISEALRILFGSNQEPEPSLTLEQALVKRLGQTQYGQYSKKVILDYLQVSTATFNRIIEAKFLYRTCFDLAETASVIIKFESSLTLEERLFEELLFVLDNSTH